MSKILHKVIAYFNYLDVCRDLLGYRYSVLDRTAEVVGRNYKKIGLRADLFKRDLQNGDVATLL